MRKVRPKKRRQVAPKPAIVGKGLKYPTKEKSGSPVSQTINDEPKDNKGMGNTFTYIIIGLAIGVGYVLITKKK